MKILLVAPYFYPKNYGGAPYVYKKIIDFSVNNFSVFTDFDNSIFDKIMYYDKKCNFQIIRSRNLIFINNDGKKIFNYFRLMWHVLYTSFNYIKCIVSLNPDLIICGQVYDVGWLCSLNIIFNKKTICYVHGEEITTKRPDGLWAKIKTIFLKKILNYSSSVIAVSNYTKSEICRRFNIFDKVIIVNNGVDIDKYFSSGKNLFLQEKYNVYGCKVLISLTRLVQKKGLDLVISSLPEILSNVPDVKLLIGGDGYDRFRLEYLAEKYDVRDKVIFAGFVPDNLLNDFINLGDIFVMPNRDIDGDTEGFGLVFLQASACGLPVIGGSAGGTSDAIKDGRSGFLIDGANKDEFVARVTEIFRDDCKRRRMGEFGQAWVTAECNWRLRVKQFDEIINKI